MAWVPQRSLADSETILTSPGAIHELATMLIDGRPQRVYKNLWPSIRQFWLSAISSFAQDTYLVYGQNRWTFQAIHQRALKLASLFSAVYHIGKGDRVAICARNSPEYLIAFWACHLLGAVTVLLNAWLPLESLRHCLEHTECKIALLDSERADLLQPVARQLLQTSTIQSCLVLDDPAQHIIHRNYMVSLEESLKVYHPNGSELLQSLILIHPEDNATVIFTSGTTGLPKGVLSTQRQFLTNVLNVLAGGFRATLRRGEDLPVIRRSIPQRAALVNVPLFHVTGLTSYSMMATMLGMKIVLMRKWDVEAAVRLIKKENVTIAGGVPSMVADLTTSSNVVGCQLECLLFGGAPAPESLVQRASKAFPSATLTQGYGLTETNSIAVSFAGEDYTARPTSTGIPSPVNEIRIVRDGIAVLPNVAGEVWLRGPNVMKCYWRDPEATSEAITGDGWLKSGDIGYLDDEGFLYIQDRVKDIIIRGGENIDSVSVENALYADPRVREAAVVGVPDEKLGEVVTAVVFLHPGQVKGDNEKIEESLIQQVRKRLPRFAVPTMIVITKTLFERTPSGKIIKDQVRKLARTEWELRRRTIGRSSLSARL